MIFTRHKNLCSFPRTGGDTSLFYHNGILFFFNFNRLDFLDRSSNFLFFCCHSKNSFANKNECHCQASKAPVSGVSCFCRMI